MTGVHLLLPPFHNPFSYVCVSVFYPSNYCDDDDIILIKMKTGKQGIIPMHEKDSQTLTQL